MRLTPNTLSENVCAQVSKLVNRRLAAATDPHGEQKQEHRKVSGPTLVAAPESFERIAREAERYSDLIAERTAGPGRGAVGQSRSRPSGLSFSYPLRAIDESESPFGVVVSLAAFWQCVHEATGQSAAIGAADTVDFFTEKWPGVDDRLWFVESRAARI